MRDNNCLSIDQATVDSSEGTGPLGYLPGCLFTILSLLLNQDKIDAEKRISLIHDIPIYAYHYDKVSLNMINLHII